MNAMVQITFRVALVVALAVGLCSCLGNVENDTPGADPVDVDEGSALGNHPGDSGDAEVSEIDQADGSEWGDHSAEAKPESDGTELAGGEIAVEEGVETAACNPDQKATWANGIGTIIKNRCASCHSSHCSSYAGLKSWINNGMLKSYTQANHYISGTDKTKVLAWIATGSPNTDCDVK